MAPKEMPKTYDPNAYEKKLYDWWEAQGYFKPNMESDKEPFVIAMPPPNVTGVLHLGHAITASLEDLMIRYHRMQGYPTLWIPGTDHAGIATQNVVERALAKEGLTRHDLGREKFLERAWQWKEEHGRRITEQHRRLGVSCDWERERFTMDPGLSRAVREAFVRLYRKGLIYRGTYLVNWCPRCETAISDLEVIHQEEETSLWYVRYPLEPAEEGAPAEYITVATTRPETILGDTAVAVHPEDERYRHLVGRYAVLPVIGRRIPIIADAAVDPSFGTGAVKVTPAHDPTDYEIGLRHGLEQINVMDERGRMNDLAGPFAGQDRYECRKNLVQELERAGLLVKIEPHRHAVGHCQRCDTVIEPRLSTQWFVRIKPLAEPAIEVVRDGRIRIIPERFTKVYFNWMENIRDWCISRQLWWGHQIPVWYCDDCGRETAATEAPSACAHCGSTRIHQDPDVLDTWFSSGLWPFSILGWPDDTEDFRRFYPTSVLETGYDILFFWVARMIMLGLEMTGKIPFHTVYLHGLIRDKYGRKMSKSAGNAIDPIEVMDQYGTDALRFTLLTGSTPGNDMKLDLERVEANRNFANKIWNAARFVVMNLEDASGAKLLEEFDPSDWARFNLPQRWIISRLHRLIREVTRLIEDYQFGEAGRQMYDFLWSEYCDWFIEIAKADLYRGTPEAKRQAQRVLVYVLERTLRLLHPYMPFVTEAIWQHLTDGGITIAGKHYPSIMIAPWPEAGQMDEAAEEEMSLLIDIIRGIRNVRAEYNVEPGRRIAAIIEADTRFPVLNEHRDIIIEQARLDPEKLTLVEKLPAKPTQAVGLVIGGVEVYVPLAGMVDIEAERQRVLKEIAQVEAEMARVEKLLSNPGFLNKAPAEVVEREREKRAQFQENLEKLRRRLELLG
jgi:valyl-tRNA synthetase